MLDIILKKAESPYKQIDEHPQKEEGRPSQSPSYQAYQEIKTEGYEEGQQPQYLGAGRLFAEQGYKMEKSHTDAICDILRV